MLDTNKLFKILTNDSNLCNIPLAYIVQVAVSVIDAINSGECLIKWKD